MYFSRFNPFNQTWWNQVQQMQSDMSRLLERFGDTGRTAANGSCFPACNIWEEENAVTVEAELPGLNLEDLEIYVNGSNHLTIQGERKHPAQEKSVQHRRERQFGSFTRSITLPVAVDANQVDAKLENGVLKIRLGKHEQAKPRKIVVKG